MKSTIHVGKYTSHMDGMGYMSSPWSNLLDHFYELLGIQFAWQDKDHHGDETVEMMFPFWGHPIFRGPDLNVQMLERVGNNVNLMFMGFAVRTRFFRSCEVAAKHKPYMQGCSPPAKCTVYHYLWVSKLWSLGVPLFWIKTHIHAVLWQNVISINLRLSSPPHDASTSTYQAWEEHIFAILTCEEVVQVFLKVQQAEM